MDEEACNYNPRANVDGYCWFAPDGCLCEDGPNQDIDPCGTCFITTPYYHCMDLKVLNDFINLNPTLSGQSPADIGFQIWGDSSTFGRRLVLLNLSNTQISNLPESIGSLSNLTTLDLHANTISNIPESIGSLSNLTTLDLHANTISSIPETLCNLNESCNIYVFWNRLCEEYHYDCIDEWGVQEQSNCP